MAEPFDQVPLAMETLGPDTTGRDVLFIHGAWHGAWCWGELAQAAADSGYRVHLLELPGHGSQSWPLPAMTTPKHYASYAARAVASLDRPVIVGHSMGGWIVQKILERFDLPAVLLAPLPGSGLPILRTINLFKFSNAWQLLIFKSLSTSTPEMARELFWPRMPDERLPAYLEALVPEPTLAALTMGVFMHLGFCRANPPMGKSPRLLIAADEDYFMPPATMSRLAQDLGADYILLRDKPHNFWLDDRNGETAHILLNFLDNLPIP